MSLRTRKPATARHGERASKTEQLGGRLDQRNTPRAAISQVGGINNLCVSRDSITQAIAKSTAYHLHPLMVAVRDHGCQLSVVTQSAERFTPPSLKPTILPIGDDLDQALGPNAFHQKSLRRFIRRAQSAVIISCAPLTSAYAAGATAAVIARRDALIVETRLEHEESWRRFIVGISPNIRMLIATVKSPGGLQ